MEQSNLDRFNGLAKQILEKLIEACPVGIDLKVTDFGLQAGGTGRDGFYSASSDEIFFDQSIQWLVTEGYARSVGGSYVATLATLDHFNRRPNVLT